MARFAMLALLIAMLGSSAALAQAPVPRPPDGTYTYRWSKADQVVGQSTVSSHLRGNQIVVSTQSTLTNLAIAQARMTFSVKLLDFQSYTGFLSSNGTDLSIDLAVQNRVVAGLTKTQAGAIPISVQPFGSSAPFAIDDGLLGTYLFLPAQIRARNANAFLLITALTGTSGNVNFSTSNGGPYPYGVPTNDIVVNLGPNTILWYNPQTLVVDQFTRADLTARLLGQT